MVPQPQKMTVQLAATVSTPELCPAAESLLKALPKEVVEALLEGVHHGITKDTDGVIVERLPGSLEATDSAGNRVIRVHVRVCWLRVIRAALRALGEDMNGAKINFVGHDDACSGCFEGVGTAKDTGAGVVA